ncbi:hypothetical protein TRFO_23300 [Tritrichomonas foetus]|uniref:Homeobox domain-containing protein n=1 Tax=Tritrichomonas foetus TaxID=1144522 RepID=A0A1J4KAI6_9EUKA|nr:hypothetical protein TRFO_23300 [Tritrichomonas foetus]|eukprot:OHT08227.1 hypothetical protein TRFO_23300 [Tritrichomonas foetus]
MDDIGITSTRKSDNNDSSFSKPYFPLIIPGDLNFALNDTTSEPSYVNLSPTLLSTRRTKGEYNQIADEASSSPCLSELLQLNSDLIRSNVGITCPSERSILDSLPSNPQTYLQTDITPFPEINFPALVSSNNPGHSQGYIQGYIPEDVLGYVPECASRDAPLTFPLDIDIKNPFNIDSLQLDLQNITFLESSMMNFPGIKDMLMKEVIKQAKNSNKKTRTNFTKETRKILYEWLEKNASNPYATVEDYKHLMSMTGLTKKQISTFLVNNRSRVLGRTPKNGKARISKKRLQQLQVEHEEFPIMETKDKNGNEELNESLLPILID